MSRTSPLGLLYAVTRALALVTVVLVIGFGASLHAHGIMADDAVAYSGVLVDDDHDHSRQAVEVDLPSATHCGGGAVCVVVLPSAPTLLPTPRKGLARFADVDFAVASSPTFGLLRPPRLG